MVWLIRKKYGMNGIDFVADTNILIYVHEGNMAIKPFLD
jgi:hypothetical protein